MNPYLGRVLFNQAGDGGGAGGGASAGAGGNAGGGAGGSGPGSDPNGGSGGKGDPSAGAGARNAGGAKDVLFDDGKGAGNGGAGNGNAGDGKGGGAPGSATNPGQQGGSGGATVTIPTNWKEALPVELREDGTIKITNTVEDLAKTLVNAQKMIGVDKVPIPGKHANDTDWKEAFHKLGNPRTVEDYQLEIDPAVEKLVDKSFLEEFRKSAHAAGVLPRQANQLVKFFGELNQKSWQAMEGAHEQALKENMDALNKEWGSQGPANTVAAKAAIHEFCTKEDTDYLRSMGLGKDARFLRIMAKVGSSLSEDKLRAVDQGGGAGGARIMTPQQAQEKIGEINSNLKHPYWVKEHENHAAAKKEMEQLFKYRYPAKSS